MNSEFMRLAVSLSRQGFPAPNPHVGCVIVQSGVVVGEGYHDHAGAPHAEAMALAQAGELARGADVYVTLEPCNHTGRTPPCANALVNAKVARVFVATRDPNPVAAGGAETLRSAGIEVSFGLLEEEARKDNWQFFEAIRLGRPVVTVKVAMSLDGRIASASGESKWITGPQARQEAHRLRAECGAVLVGYRTVIADNPELTARIPGVVNQPVRVVVDPDHRLSTHHKVFNEAAETIHVTGRPLELNRVLLDLFARKIRGVLVEGGGLTIERFLQENLVDHLRLFVAPKVIGTGQTWSGQSHWPSLLQSPEFKISSATQFGPDILISATRADELS